MESRRRISFIHVPKCAGMAVGNAIRETYFPRRWRWSRRLAGVRPFRAVTVGARASVATAHDLGLPLAVVRSALLHYHLQDPTIAYLSGHLPFTGAIGEKFSARWDFVTVLRRPVDRFMSEYRYNRYKSSDHFKIEEDLEPFLETPDARRLGSQLVNFLTGRREVDSTPSAQQVRQAMANLEEFTVVGLTERLDRFASAMEDRYGRALRIAHTNRSPAPPEVASTEDDAGIRRKIAELNAGDSEVYERAVRLTGA